MGKSSISENWQGKNLSKKQLIDKQVGFIWEWLVRVGKSVRSLAHKFEKSAHFHNIMKYTPLSPELFKTNRKRFTAEMKPGTVAIFNSNDQFPRSGDQYHNFRQNAGLFWLNMSAGPWN